MRSFINYLKKKKTTTGKKTKKTVKLPPPPPPHHHLFIKAIIWISAGLKGSSNNQEPVVHAKNTVLTLKKAAKLLHIKMTFKSLTVKKIKDIPVRRHETKADKNVPTQLTHSSKLSRLNSSDSQPPHVLLLFILFYFKCTQSASREKTTTWVRMCTLHGWHSDPEQALFQLQPEQLTVSDSERSTARLTQVRRQEGASRMPSACTAPKLSHVVVTGTCAHTQTHTVEEKPNKP